jgi:hypothetical protein
MKNKEHERKGKRERKKGISELRIYNNQDRKVRRGNDLV